MPREFYTNIAPILDKFDSENTHNRAREALHFAEATPLRRKLLEKAFAYEGARFFDDRLNVSLGTIQLDNPLLVGAGWDKPGRAVAGLYTLGFSGVTVGTVAEYPQEGNPKPRQFALDHGVRLNRIGFETPGMDGVAANLERYKESGIPIGISLGKNKEVPLSEVPAAHARVAERLYDYASYFEINVSSPNTPGLRELQYKAPLTDIVQAVNETMDNCGSPKPLFVKVAPELTYDAVDDVIEVVVYNGLTGIVAANTTNDPEVKAQYGEQWRNEAGGLSGDNASFRQMSTEMIAHIYREAGEDVVIIGSGGINSSSTAWEKLTAGATALQIVTGIPDKGPSLPGRINRKIVDFMESEGLYDLTKIIGTNLTLGA